MPVLIDISEDEFYLQGIERGIEQEKQRAQEKEKQTIIKMYQSGIKPDIIAEILEIDIQIIKNLIGSLQ